MSDKQQPLAEVLQHLDKIARSHPDSRLEADFAGHAGGRSHVFGEAASAVAETREEELEADANVVADSAADVVDVAVKTFAEVGHLVDEADFC